jgi:POT family proton-dependent oligopeptide transporter
MVTKLSVQRVAGMMMGVWFLSSAFAAYAGGMIAGLTAISQDGGGVESGLASLAVYTGVFENLAIIAIGFGALVLFASPYLHRRMR